MSEPFNGTTALPRSPILFYDGVCSLCNRSVHWVVRHDRAGIFRFASLQSAAAARMLPPNIAGAGAPSTMVLLDGADVFVKSDAWLRTLRRLGAPWAWLTLLGIFPRSARDTVYDFIAARRYRWFGKLERCPLPKPELRGRFLD